ncbi:zinc finger protein 726-like [Belonocnema kinseyi]|uniref:zinc finger protein 726-like n=1 Tax=Belonocnema kinseyi TaxID=2817044 RepID=UPI00143DE749|nr:zinc finger protein 726-like [Belonocnema kinseyi]
MGKSKLKIVISQSDYDSNVIAKSQYLIHLFVILLGTSNSEWTKSRIESTGVYEPYLAESQKEYCNVVPTNTEKNFSCSIQYSNDESLEIKEEIIKGKSNSDWTKTRIPSAEEYKEFLSENQRELHNLPSRNKGHDFTGEHESSNDKTLNIKEEFTEIEHSNEDILEIKEEVIEDQEITGQKQHKEYGSKWCTLYIKENAHLSVSNKLPSHKEHTIQESEQEPKKKYKCEKCALSYTLKSNLYRHKKFECDVIPQFRCKFCDKRFKQKCHMTTHVDQVHQKTHVDQVHQKTSPKKSVLSYKCDICFRSYSWLVSLNRHKRSEHAAVKPQFICDLCGYKSNRKSNLVKHMTSRHSQMLKSRYKCDKCSRSYTWLSALNRHKRTKHSAVKPQFICDYCGHKTHKTTDLSNHIILHHLKKIGQSIRNNLSC